MPRPQLLSLALSAVFAVAFAGCSTDSTTSESTGSLNMNLELAPGITINEVDWTISGGDMEDMTGTIDTSAPGATASVEVFGLPPVEGYTVTLEATDESGEVSCKGDAEFGVEVGVSTDVMVFLNCKIPTNLGGVRVNGKFNICAQVAKVVVSPLQTSVGNNISLSAQAVDTEGDQVSFEWTATGGSIADASAADTSYTCEQVGEQSITITVSDAPECMDDWTVAVTCVDGGMPMPTGNVTAVHLAPEVPSAESTAVALFVNGAEATDLGTLEYSQSTGKIALPVGTYDIGIGVPGGDMPLLQLDGVEVTEATDLVVVAYRTNAELPVNVLVFVNSTDGLEAGSGRVFVGHGANDSALNPVDVSLGEAPECSTLIPGFAFETIEPDGGLDLPGGTYQIGFDLTPDDENDCADFGPVPVPVTADVVSILVAVDEDTTDTSEVETALTPELWAIIPDADAPNNQPIRTIQLP